MNQARRKLLNSILFFAKNTKYLGITKLSKLLFFFDFLHFDETGYPAIGLRYQTFPKGPVPKEFWLEVKEGNPPADFKSALSITFKNDPEEGRSIFFIAKEKPDMRIFTPREIRILKKLGEFYKSATAEQMSEITHLKNTPWDKTKKSCGLYCPIEYMLMLNHDSNCDPQKAEANLRDFFDMEANFSISPTQ